MWWYASFGFLVAKKKLSEMALESDISILAVKKLGSDLTGEKEESEKRKCPGTNANGREGV